jgi:hypothetical protein
MRSKNFSGKLLAAAFLVTLFLQYSSTQAQEITTYQYRYVAPGNVTEFIKRETTYWSKVAQKAIDKGTLTFWGLFERVGGSNAENLPNYLFINTFKNIDGDMNDIWNATALFPNIPLAKMETNAISKVTNDVFLSNGGWQQRTTAVTTKDFNYVVMNYHNSSNAAQFNAIENNHWGPFIKNAMDHQQTKQAGWGNALVLAPTGGDMKFNCLSFDLFPTLQTALLGSFTTDTKFPTAGLDSLQKISLNDPIREIYRVVKVVSKN